MLCKIVLFILGLSYLEVYVYNIPDKFSIDWLAIKRMLSPLEDELVSDICRCIDSAEH